MSDENKNSVPEQAAEANAPAVAAEDGAKPQEGKGEEGKPSFPSRLPVLPSREIILFPDMVTPLLINTPRDAALIDEVLMSHRFLVVAPARGDGDHEIEASHLFEHGCAAAVLKMLRFPDGTIRILVQGIKRVKLLRLVQEKPFFAAEIAVAEDVMKSGVKIDALYRSLRSQFEKMLNMLPQAPDEVKVAAVNIVHPGRFADLVAANINLSMEERYTILAEADVQSRMEKLAVFLARELQIVELGSKIQEDVKEKIGKGQREFFLREQLNAIRRELGEDDGRLELEELQKAVAESGMPDEARKEAERELKRLERMQPGSAEYTVSRTYLDWLVALPWSKCTADRLDLIKAKRILDADHYDLAKVKERIVEFLAVRKIHPQGRSAIMCFVGPPGVGKTSLGRSIAQAMGRNFVRISLGGVRDEAEIRGHRRTYIGALPGRIIQGIRRAGSRNPVFMLDEIDKLSSDYRGDPAAALLEVLDPEQNQAFLDHYLDVPFDLSQVIFITTANLLDPVPPALRDRMEVIDIPGYAEEEKIQIARRHLIPKIFAEHGIAKNRIRLSDAAVSRVITEYTREAGLRNLERELGAMVRKVAVKIASGKRGVFRLGRKEIKAYLGPPRYFGENARQPQPPGVAIGLSWTPVGGDILFVESTRMPGKKGLLLTGRLGEVIKESAQAALSWLRSQGDFLGIKPEVFEESDIHIHFPEGATPKDGPSAGLALVASLLSLLRQTSVSPRLAMTGEITLRGRVLPVGGIKEKVLAARRSGIKDVILPADNMNDLSELPAEVRKELRFHPVRAISDILHIAFPALWPRSPARCAGRAARKTR